MSIHFYKYHCSGKDYLIYDTTVYPVPLTRDAVRKICDRNYSSGSDGLLAGPFFTEKGIQVCMYNSDGNDADDGTETGIRIISQYLKDMGHSAGKMSIPEHLKKETTGEEIFFVGGMILSDAYIRRNNIGCRISA